MKARKRRKVIERVKQRLKTWKDTDHPNYLRAKAPGSQNPHKGGWRRRRN